MPKHARCAVGFCDDNKRYPDLAYVTSHVNNLTFHNASDLFNPSRRTSGALVCSNHFSLGRRTPENLKTDYPSIFMTVSDYLPKKFA